MSRASISQTAQGLALSGEIDSQSAVVLRREGARLIQAQNGSTVLVDLSAVTRANSVGLALMLAFMRDAKARKKQLTIKALPADMRQMAEVCGVLAILPLADG